MKYRTTFNMDDGTQIVGDPIEFTDEEFKKHWEILRALKTLAYATVRVDGIITSPNVLRIISISMEPVSNDVPYGLQGAL